MFKKRHPSVGARPGTLVVSETAPPPRIRVMKYGLDSVHEFELDEASELTGLVDDDSVTWIDIQGLGDEATLLTIAQQLDIHPLAMEDIVNTPQRPSVADHDERLLIICRMANSLNGTRLEMEQFSIVLGQGLVITFQETYGDVLDPVRRRIRTDGSRLRRFGADYLAYALLDTIVDAYYPILERLGDRLEYLENEVIDRPVPELLRQLIRLKNRLVDFRRIVWAQREMVRALSYEDTPLIGEKVRVFVRDVYDHCVQTAEVVESYREMTTGLMNTYLSSVGQRTNEVMKVLTIMSSVFIPLTFLAGIYGMNFEHMPELSWQGSYPALLLTMLVTGAGMMWFFFKLGWLGRATGKADLVWEEMTEPTSTDVMSLTVLDHDVPAELVSSDVLRKSA
jgi:magnesium transporter